MNVLSSQSTLPSISQRVVKPLILKLEVFFYLQCILQTGVQMYTYNILPLRFAGSEFLEVLPMKT